MTGSGHPFEFIGEAFRVVLCMQEEADERAKIAEEAAAAAEDASEEEGEEADSDGDADDEGSGELLPDAPVRFCEVTSCTEFLCFTCATSLS